MWRHKTHDRIRHLCHSVYALYIKLWLLERTNIADRKIGIRTFSTYALFIDRINVTCQNTNIFRMYNDVTFVDPGAWRSWICCWRSSSTPGSRVSSQSSRQLIWVWDPTPSLRVFSRRCWTTSLIPLISRCRYWVLAHLLLGVTDFSVWHSVFQSISLYDLLHDISTIHYSSVVCSCWLATTCAALLYE